ncbi:D-tyrosyl-tRNA deacylase [Laetiporus sulphureus 93-53]|uniref:D-aminoacyl-tRNA deacylase n=1 Tax=Laetiporus sulphureus 93-53 TaxID=1314785 RepID=A0A165FYE0_9APHY|nr:D-tyrosyl-tRNA deacylase [Laetiporus sulphureus 93-53]KZT09579.1 D-tyrosyl-tRNA deacylase [Laetiporus sulphureus 93-53]
MRAVVQRVRSASVTVDSEVISSISRGLMVLVGIGKDDTPVDVENVAKKILNLRIFDDGSGAMWKKSVKDIDGEVLCVSQFTLLANTTKGNKPDFHRAMTAESSRQMYTSFLERISSMYKPEKIKDGRFGAMMSVSLVNEGPVTLTLDSRKFDSKRRKSAGECNESRKLQPPF